MIIRPMAIGDVTDRCIRWSNSDYEPSASQDTSVHLLETGCHKFLTFGSNSWPTCVYRSSVCGHSASGFASPLLGRRQGPAITAPLTDSAATLQAALGILIVL